MSWTDSSPRSMRAGGRADASRRGGKRILMTGASLAALGVVVALVVNAHHEPDPTRLVGQPAPEFMLPDLVGQANEVRADGAPALTARRGMPAAQPKQVSASRYIGHVWVLHTFGTWCRPCNEEHSALVKYASTHHVPVVGVDQGDEPQEVLNWLAKHGNPYSAVVADVLGEVAEAYDVKGVPQYFVIDAAGTIRARFYGPLEADEIEERLAPWVASAT